MRLLQEIVRANAQTITLKVAVRALLERLCPAETTPPERLREIEGSLVARKDIIAAFINETLDRLEEEEEGEGGGEAAAGEEEEEDNSGEDYNAKKRKKQDKKEKKKEKKKRRKKEEEKGGEEEEEEEQPKKKKKKKSRKGKKREDEEDTMPSTKDGGMTKADADDGEPDSFKGSVRTRRKRIEIPVAELERQSLELVARIGGAYEDDARLIAERRPALNKLRLLPEVTAALVNRDLAEVLLENGVLEALGRWLRPLADGSLPNLNIRAALLGLLRTLPVDPQRHLKENGIGSVVRMLANSALETPENRAIAKDLYDTWSRRMFNLTASYRDLEAAQAQKQGARPAGLGAATAGAGGGGAGGTPKRSVLDHAWVGDGKRAFIPAKDTMDFVRRPKPEQVPEATPHIVTQFERMWRLAKRNSDLR
jgi:transcription factor SPN1